MDRMFDILYVQGYTAALQDVLQTINNIQTDLKIHKRRQNYKTYKAIVECMLKNRVILREESYAFVRCSSTNSDGFEIYIEKRGVYNPNTE
jgi:hypothetical protein